ncbi:MAG TPA: circadian clock KaiB family protein [Flavobacterium sp.]|nr:circadian clock KaiB family protein [Flavobacterium sp.]
MENPNDNIAAEKYTFILFVTGMSVKSAYAIENLRRLCDKYLDKNFDLQIVDISREKEMAVKHQIIAIPTLIKTAPGQQRTILGDLSDTRKVLHLLDINP